ncbi:MAG: hypothetical protein KDD46_05765 [Bdellovibrionales bacterium]|nr:hypothetical protein [Bdellovibrionales bacterium]
MNGRNGKRIIFQKKHFTKQLFLSLLVLTSFLQFANFSEVEESQQNQKYLSSGFGGMQNVALSQRSISNELSINLSQFKSFKQDFGSTQLQDSLEANSNMLINYQVKNSLHVITNLGFTYSKQDIRSLGEQNQAQTRHEKMIYGSVGIDKYFLRDLALRTNVGLVRCKDFASDNVNLYPTASLTLSKDFQKSNMSLSLASEALGGGSFTGMYGNQMLHHGKISLSTQLSKKLMVQGDLAFGQTRDAYIGNQKAMIFASHVGVNYTIIKNIEFGVGVYNRMLTNESDFSEPVKEGMMYMANMKVSYF